MYVLIFPRGDSGWSFDQSIRGGPITRGNSKLTQMKHYRYKLHDRILLPAHRPNFLPAEEASDDEGCDGSTDVVMHNATASATENHPSNDTNMPDADNDPEDLESHRNFNALLLSQRLLQQFVTDMYCKILSDKLVWFRTHQDQLNTEQWRGAVDALADDAPRIGTPRVRLPSSFEGSNRNLFLRYLDAMAMLSQVSDNGRADYFITFTCNPKWPELSAALKNSAPEHRPDLIARVFMLKLAKLEDLIKNQNVLGHVIGYVRVIEYQKRYVPTFCLIVFTISHIHIRVLHKYCCYTYVHC